MAKKQFYLVKRKDKLTLGKATFYCRFRDAEGNLLAWRSTEQTAEPPPTKVGGFCARRLKPTGASVTALL